MRVLIILLFLIAGFNSQAQSIRVNLMTGFSNYFGDLQQKRFTLNQAHHVYGVGATLEITNKLLLRGEYNYGKIGADDKFNPKASFRTRNLNFTSLIQEAAVMAEYNLVNVYEHKVVPYVFGGLAVFKFSPFTIDSLYGKQYLIGLSTEGQGLPQYPNRKIYKNMQLSIPLGGGIKYAISDDIQVGLEYGLRITSTDYLDDVSTTYVDKNILLNAKGPVAVSLAFRGDEVKNNPKPYPVAGATRGGAKEKDNYYYGLVRLSIRMNWFDNLTGNTNNMMGCPGRVL